MKQLTLPRTGFERYGKTTRRAVFLAEMEQAVPWPALCGLIDPVYRKLGDGRPPIGVERMLRIYFLQQWFNLSDPAVEEALYDSAEMRDFVGIDLSREPVPDETTVCRFRHLLETHDLGRRLFDEVQQHLASKGLKMATGTIVDATIINAPSSTKNADKARDPEMHQTKKGNQWYFGMKAHLGVDSRSKLIHAAVATRPMSPTARCCPICCTGAKPACGAIRPTAASVRRSGSTHQRPRTLPIAAIAIAPSWMRSNGSKTAPSPKCGPGLNIRSASSSRYLASPRCAIAG
jgi:IS5 family transposase